jgi:hypothetical protein
MLPPSAHFDADQAHIETAYVTSDGAKINGNSGKVALGISDKPATVQLGVANENNDCGEIINCELDATNGNESNVGGNLNDIWDEEISIDLPELDLRDSQALLLLSWILLVYRNTEKNQDSPYTFNNITASIKETIFEDGEATSKTLLRVRQSLDKSDLSTTSNDMILSTVAINAEYSSQVCRPR